MTRKSQNRKETKNPGAAHDLANRKELLTLTALEQQSFVNALLHPPAPSEELRAATLRYHEVTNRAK
jgi:uncharacterized protein (DUF1778 family)